MHLIHHDRPIKKYSIAHMLWAFSLVGIGFVIFAFLLNHFQSEFGEGLSVKTTMMALIAAGSITSVSLYIFSRLVKSIARFALPIITTIVNMDSNRSIQNIRMISDHILSLNSHGVPKTDDNLINILGSTIEDDCIHIELLAGNIYGTLKISPSDLDADSINDYSFIHDSSPNYNGRCGCCNTSETYSLPVYESKDENAAPHNSLCNPCIDEIIKAYIESLSDSERGKLTAHQI